MPCSLKSFPNQSLPPVPKQQHPDLDPACATLQSILANPEADDNTVGRAQALLRWAVDSAAMPSLCDCVRQATSYADDPGEARYTLRGRLAWC